MKSLVLILLIGYAALGLYFYFVQRSYIYFPTRRDFNDCPAFAAFEKTVWNGSRMYVKKASETWVVFYHGNAGSACDRDYVSDLFGGEYSLLIPEYTGYSNDTAAPTETRLKKNVEDVISYLSSQKVEGMVVAGESLGAALAGYHNFLKPANRTILISPFSSLADVAGRHYWFLPTKLLLKDQYPLSSWLRKTDNVLIIHGERDDIIPIESGRALFDSIQGAHKLFVEIPEAGHNDIYQFSDVSATIKEFLVEKSTTAQQ